MKDFINKNRWFLITILSTLLVMLFIYAINGVVPFGNNLIPFVDFDSIDVPVYYKLWDFLHGNGSFLFDWNIGSGLNSIHTLVSNSLLFPSSLLIFLFPRSFIPYGLCYILIFKYIIFAMIFYSVINKVFPKLDGSYKYIFTLLYVFSGWGLLMMANISYIDVVGLFPLLVLGLYNILKDFKWKLYVISYSLIFIFNYFIAYQILLFILGVVIISLFTLDYKDKLKKVLLLLFLTILSLGISSILVLPSFYQYISSYKELYLNDTSFISKVVYLLTLGIPFGISYKQLLVKKDKKVNIFYFILLLYILIPLFIDPINSIWNIDNNGYIFKQAFIINFVLIIGSLYYLNNFDNKNKFNRTNLVCFISLMILIILMSITLSNSIRIRSLLFKGDSNQLISILIIFTLIVISTLLLFKLDRKYFKRCFIILGISNTLLFSYFYIVNNYDYRDSINTNNLNINIPDDYYNYVDVYDSLNINSPYILSRPSMNNYLNVIKSNELLFNDIFNYQVNGSIISSSGGTIFTNALLQNKYFITNDELNDIYYNLLDSDDNYYLYESKYNFNYIIPYSGNLYDEDYGSYLVNNNMLFKTLFNSDKDLIHIDTIKDIDGIYHLDFKPNRTYYLVIDYNYEDREGTVYSLGENNLNFENMFIDSSLSKVYATFRVDNNEKLDIVKDDYLTTNVEIGYIDDKEYIDFMNSLDLFDVDVSVSNNSKSYKFNSSYDTDILIPINYDDSLRVYVNGKEVDYKCNVINMISIKVNKGDNEVVIKYIPKYFKEGIYISIISLLILFGFYFISKKYIK